MEKNRIQEIAKKLNEGSLTIGRIPEQTKRDFINLANSECVGDYGWMLSILVNDYFLFKSFKQIIAHSDLKVTIEGGEITIK